MRNRAELQEMFVEFAATRDPRVRSQLIEAHVGLAQHLARRFTHRGEPYEDLVQVGSLGLIKSVDRYDPARGVEFTTYATKTILGELKRYFRDKAWAIRAPRRVQELYLHVGQVEGDLTQELKRTPTLSELVSETGATESDLREAIDARRVYRSTSLDSAGPDEETLGARIGGEDYNFDTAEWRVVLGPRLEALNQRDREILRMRFSDGLTQLEIAERVGLSQMHVSRLIARSLNTLREACLAAVSEGTTELPGERSA
ncbi:MAG: SigB/SigF/SigG family RNA polymerase sigma factor [Acidimicrobiales bacterium]